MLKKVLKYDLNSVFRYWWIAAVTSLIFSFIGSGCIYVFNTERELPVIVESSAIFLMFFVFFSYSAFTFVSVILIFLRFYKNFFTDEGYLTFTLPVRCSQLLNSKLVMSTVVIVATYAVCAVDILVMFCIGMAKDIFTKEVWDFLVEGWEIFTDELGIYLAIYLLEAFIIVILSTAFSCLFLFCCISFASIITKKAKVITAIGIYYGANSIWSFAMQIFYVFAIPSFLTWVADLKKDNILMVLALAMLGIIFFMSVFCMILYTLQYWMIDRKLNLS